MIARHKDTKLHKNKKKDEQQCGSDLRLGGQGSLNSLNLKTPGIYFGAKKDLWIHLFSLNSLNFPWTVFECSMKNVYGKILDCNSLCLSLMWSILIIQIICQWYLYRYPQRLRFCWFSMKENAFWNITALVVFITNCTVYILTHKC